MAVPKQNVTVNLYFEGDDTTIVATDVTNELGLVSFTNLPVGTYVAKAVLPAGYTHHAEDVENIYSDTNGSNDNIEVVSGKVVMSGIDVVKNMPSYVTIVIDLKFDIGFKIVYTSGVSMAISMFTPIAVASEITLYVNWQLRNTDLGLEDVIRHAGLESVFVIGVGDTESNTVTVITGFEDGSQSGLDPAPIDSDTFDVLGYIGNSVYVLNADYFELGSAFNLAN